MTPQNCVGRHIWGPYGPHMGPIPVGKGIFCWIKKKLDSWIVWVSIRKRFFWSLCDLVERFWTAYPWYAPHFGLNFHFQVIFQPLWGLVQVPKCIMAFKAKIRSVPSLGYAVQNLSTRSNRLQKNLFRMETQIIHESSVFLIQQIIPFPTHMGPIWVGHKRFSSYVTYKNTLINSSVPLRHNLYVWVCHIWPKTL